MSDRKPSPEREISLTTYWPKEAGRPSSDDEDFVVSAYHIEYLPPGKELVHALTCYTNLHPNVHMVSCGLDNQEIGIVLNASWVKRDWSGGRPPNPGWEVRLYSKTDGL